MIILLRFGAFVGEVALLAAVPTGDVAVVLLLELAFVLVLCFSFTIFSSLIGFVEALLPESITFLVGTKGRGLVSMTSLLSSISHLS